MAGNTVTEHSQTEYSPKKRCWKAWMVVGILVFFVALAGVDRSLIGLVVDPIKNSFHIDDIRMGLLQGPVFAVFFLVGSLPMGWIVDRCPKRLILFLGVVVWSLGTVAFGLAGSFPGLVFARAFLALGQTVLQPAGWSMLGKLFPADKLSLALGVLASGMQIGAASSYLLGGFLIAWAGESTANPLSVLGPLSPWQLVFVAAGVFGLAAAFLVFIIPVERAGQKNVPGPDSAGLKAFVRANLPFLALHFTGFSLLSAMVYGAAAWMPTYLIRTYSLDIRVVGSIFAFFHFPICAGGLVFAGWWVDRSFSAGKTEAHMRHFACMAAFAAVIGGIGFTFGSTLIASVACFAIIQFIQPFSGVAGAALQIAAPVAYRGRISAAFIMCYNAVGMTLGPSLPVFLNKYVAEENLGLSVALTYALLGGTASVVLWSGRKHFTATLMRVSAMHGEKE
jgi:MFS family permease